MTKKPAKTVPAASSKTPPGTKKSKLKLILLAGAPLALAAGGYGGWTFYGGAWAGGGEAATDAASVAAIPPEVAAETSFTYSFALSEFLKRECGAVRVAALEAASAEEARADGTLVNLAWMAANRRMDTITEISCSRMLIEVREANAQAAAQAAEAGKDKAKATH
ncbi:hypothetical protein [Arvimicrobium flavum]|uniref:hypothetical protein n=1 Tax=Arvimicrobium flavum TaxID=3393320 RepID=UPI00237BEC5C|nr:hypothetical protein [Mesorhizobium shangrilense]